MDLIVISEGHFEYHIKCQPASKFLIRALEKLAVLRRQPSTHSSRASAQAGCSSSYGKSDYPETLRRKVVGESAPDVGNWFLATGSFGVQNDRNSYRLKSVNLRHRVNPGTTLHMMVAHHHIWHGSWPMGSGGRRRSGFTKFVGCVEFVELVACLMMTSIRLGPWTLQAQTDHFAELER